MSWWETVVTAVGALGRRRMRSILTVLGILIGIAAVMVTVGLGQGAQQQVAAQINSLGSNLLVVSPGSATATTGIRGGFGSATTLTVADASVLANPAVAPDIGAVAPVSSSSQSVQAGSTTWTTSVVGSNPSWLSVRARTIGDGRFFDDSDMTNANEVVVIGGTTESELFGDQSGVGQQVTIGGQFYTVVGILNTVGASATANEDDTIVMPLTTYASRVSTSTNTNTVSSIYVEAKDQDSLSAAYQEASNALLNAHGVTVATADFTVNSQQSLVQTATSTARILTILLASVAGISLLVGGIGVMNIMLVSVTERIHEIGLRKALGATPKMIRRQFSVEACILGLTGGILGLALGLSATIVLPRFINQPVTVSPIAAVAALAVSLAIGVLAGVYPASRAAKLAPIDALRSE